MIIIGGEPSPVERVKLEAEDVNGVEYYAKNVTAVSLDQPGAIRLPASLAWPSPNVTPVDARGWWIYDAQFDQRYVDIDYINRKVVLKRVGKTEITFRLENADGTGFDLIWSLDILDKQLPLAITIDPAVDTSGVQLSAFTITAVIDGGDYPYTFRWFKDNALIKTRTTGANDPDDKTDKIIISSLNWTDEGTYYVEATDRYGARVVSSSFALSVTARPLVITGTNETVRVQQGKQWSDLYPYDGGRPPFAFLWRKDGNPTPYTQQRITIPAVAPADAGGYKLGITDSLGTQATSPGTFTLYVMEYFITAAARNAATASASVITNGGRDVAATLDLNGTDEISYTLAGKRFDNGAAVAIGAWTAQGIGSAVSAVPGASVNILKLVPQAVGSTSFKLYTDDNKSDSLNVSVVVTALPHIDAPIAIPAMVYVAGMATKPSATITPTVRASAVPESYMWERQLPGGAWARIATTKELTLGPVDAVAKDGTKYRFTVTNANSAAVSNIVTMQYLTFDGVLIARIGTNVSDGMVPGGVYTFSPNTTTQYQQRALADANTTVTYSLETADTTMTLTPSTGQLVTLSVDAGGDARSNRVQLNAKNTNGDPDAVYSASMAVSVVVPSIAVERSHTALKGIETPAAVLSLPTPYTRAEAATRAEIVTTPAGEVTSRYDAATKTVYMTGTDVKDSVSAVIRVYYKAPGNTIEQQFDLPYALSVRKRLKFQTGVSTSGDRLTAYVDSQNKIK